MRHWSPPFVGEQFMVLSPGGDMASGFVLVGLYSDNMPANGSGGNVERTTYPDGAVFEYDHVAHALKVTLPGGGNADITVSDSITVNCETADVAAASSVDVHSMWGSFVQGVLAPVRTPARYHRRDCKGAPHGLQSDEKIKDLTFGAPRCPPSGRCEIRWRFSHCCIAVRLGGDQLIRLHLPFQPLQKP
ncbi:phage baseplate assembly protein V [Variovorax sp. LjRoot130]|uniref:phage baseplate assembly protein V n=1 Tax=Variovorax sp. LjRoot130 TaxID=3342261 RepID=UPI003F519E6B